MFVLVLHIGNIRLGFGLFKDVEMVPPMSLPCDPIILIRVPCYSFPIYGIPHLGFGVGKYFPSRTHSWSECSTSWADYFYEKLSYQTFTISSSDDNYFRTKWLVIMSSRTHIQSIKYEFGNAVFILSNPIMHVAIFSNQLNLFNVVNLLARIY